MLDHSCLMFVSNMWSGSRHDSSKLPVLTVGGLSGKLETGRVLDYTEKPATDRKLCGFYLGLLNRMGVKADKFGDATAPLAGLYE